MFTLSCVFVHGVTNTNPEYYYVTCNHLDGGNFEDSLILRWSEVACPHSVLENRPF